MIEDFPKWFDKFYLEQLQEVPSFEEQSTYDIDNLNIAYIRLWSIIEIFSKIIYRLYEKRCNTKELTALENEVRQHLEGIAEYLDKIELAVQQYTSSESGELDSITFEGISKRSYILKPVKPVKYSVEKRDLASYSLPTKDKFEKACKSMNLRCPTVASLLKPDGGESKYYSTRNSIAHEGKPDITGTMLCSVPVGVV